MASKLADMETKCEARPADRRRPPRQRAPEDVLVVVGGTIPADDAAELTRAGVTAVYTPGASMRDIVADLNGRLETLA